MTSFPSNTSPTFAPRALPPRTVPSLADYALSNPDRAEDTPTSRPNSTTDAPPIVPTPALPEIVSPALTPAPGVEPARPAKQPRLLEKLPQVECVVRARIPTVSGTEVFLHLYQNDVDSKEHLAIVFGNEVRSRSLDRVHEGETEIDRMIRGAYVGRLRPGRVSSRFDENSGVASPLPSSPAIALDQETGKPHKQAPLVRIHSECYTGETAWSARCDCGEQLDEAARLMSEPTITDSGEEIPPSSGVIIYLRQEGRGIGLGEKLKAYNLQDLGSDTVEANLILRHPADARSYGLATAMLVDLGLGSDSSEGGIRLLTNNPDKVRAIEGPNREIVVKERVPMVPIAWRTNGKKGIRSSEIEDYLQAKVGSSLIVLPLANNLDR